MTRTMKALHVVRHTDPEAPHSARLEVVEKEIPQPGPGQLLIRMEAASCNPSDLIYLKGGYLSPTVYDEAAGLEGCGVVEKSGGGFMAGRMVGKRVACAGSTDDGGTWSEYYLASVMGCMPIKGPLPAEQASTLMVNPFTAFGLLDRAKELGSPAVVQNAGAGQLGRQVIAVAKLRGVPLISTVRRPEQREILKSLGAKNVLVTSDSDFADSLKELAEELDARVALDAVAGEDTARLLRNMPSRSTALVLGGLSMKLGDPLGGQFSVLEIVLRGSRIEGFGVIDSLTKLGTLGIMRRARQIQRLFRDGVLETAIQSVSGIEDYATAIDQYAANMSGGKPILKFE